MVLKSISSKQKDSEINATPLCFGNNMKDFSAGNIKKIGLYKFVSDFSVDYDGTDTADFWIFTNI